MISFSNIVIIGAINLISTVFAMLLVDRVGRRWMMLFGCIGIGASYLLCALAYRDGWRGSVVLVLTLSAIACYALILAPVTWVLIAEIFPNRVRSHGISAAVSSLWIACFVLTYSFPALNRSYRDGRDLLRLRCCLPARLCTGCGLCSGDERMHAGAD
jgi:MFS transporter, SP family, xylose:H+ symportor